MALILIDTSIAVDLLRGYLPAQTWYLQQPRLAISQAVRLEIIEGVQNRRDLDKAYTFFATCQIVPLTLDDMEWATDQLARFRLSHNVDAFDCLIASASHRLQEPIYTHNLKHFVPLLGAMAVRPYT